MWLPFGIKKSPVSNPAAEPIDTGRFSTLLSLTSGDSSIADYVPEHADQNSVVQTITKWLTREANRAPLQLRIEGDEEPITEHPFLTAMNNPNGRVSGNNMRGQIIRSLVVNGNAFVVPIQDGQILPSGTPQYLQYISWKNIRIQKERGLPSYRLETFGRHQPLDRSRLSHMIYEVDEGESLIGRSPLNSVAGFIELDRVAAQAAYGRMNGPVMAFILTIDKSIPNAPSVSAAPIVDDDREKLQEMVNRFRRTRAGDPAIIEGPYTIQELSGTVQNFDFRGIHNICEERISAPLGVPPYIAHLGSGLGQSMGWGDTAAEEVRNAYKDGLFPLLDLLEYELTQEILPYWEIDPRLHVEFDRTELLRFTTEAEQRDRDDRLAFEEDRRWRTRLSAARESGIPEEDQPDDIDNPPQPQMVDIPPQASNGRRPLREMLEQMEEVA